MSYIAKIYLNKMFKKKDCLTIDGDMLKLKVRNVLNPIPLEKPPKNIYDHFEIKGDGELIVGKGKEGPFKVVWDGKTYTSENANEAEGKVVGLGDEYEVYFPNPGWSAGETHKLYIHIIQDRPIEITIKRTIQE